MHSLVRPGVVRPKIGQQLTQVLKRHYASSRSSGTSFRRTVLGTGLLVTGTIGYLYATDTRASVHKWLAIPLIRAIYPDAEDAHEAGTRSLKALWQLGLHPRERGGVDDAGDLNIDVFGWTLSNPLGISAGLDKHGDIPDSLLALGPAIVEIGGITPRPQKGNPKPRVFRLPSQEGIINRYGLNSDGAEAVAVKLLNRVKQYAYDHGYGSFQSAEQAVLNGDAGVPPGSLVNGKLLAVQVAKQETTPDNDIDAIREDYAFGTRTLAKYADIIVVNVSCPNAPGYRELQQIGPLTKILSGVVEAAKSVDRKTKPAVMVKVSPDEDSEQQVSSICEAIWISGVDGVIVGNTTKRTVTPLPHTSPTATELATFQEKGGYSGPQLFKQTVGLVGKYRRLLDRTGHKYQEKDASSKTENDVSESIRRDKEHLKAETETYTKQPLIKIPERHSATNTSTSTADSSRLRSSSQQKVIFCTGGIRTGKEALEVLNAGASVAQIYTAMVYGGAGQITKMKKEMRQEIRKALGNDVMSGKTQ